MLKQHHATISMSRKGNPYDNAACESFMKTLKQEEVYRNEYRDFHDARASIGEFLERVYNQKRLHSALGYLPPAEFEQNGTATHEVASRHLRSGLCRQPPGTHRVFRQRRPLNRSLGSSSQHRLIPSDPGRSIFTESSRFDEKPVNGDLPP